jgi:catechol 2,3-dioxygenase-like lactoylglutathione lyase family enzyme
MSRVTEIRYVGYGVEDFDAERKFYADDWGLVEVASEDGLAWFKTHGHDEHHVVRLHKSATNCIEVIALAADSAPMSMRCRRRSPAAGCRIVHRAARRARRARRRLRLPLLLARRPAVRDLRDVARGDKPRDGALGRPAGQDQPHRAAFADHKAAVKFFTDVLGFRVSDWLGDFMCFLRCNSAHHRIAILPGPPCLNHVAYDMLGVDDMMRGISRLRQERAPTSLGPGPPHGGQQHLQLFLSRPTASRSSTPPSSRRSISRPGSPRCTSPRRSVMDQWGIGVGGPQTMPHPAPDPACSSRRRSDRVALFEYFPNYVWNLSVAIAMESGGQIGEIVDMCAPIREKRRASGEDAGTAAVHAPVGGDGRQAARTRRGGRGAGPRLLGLEQAGARRAVPVRGRADAGPRHPGREETYAKRARKAFDALDRAGPANRERVEIPLAAGTMPALFTRAPGEGRAPVRVYCNGLDSCKELLYWSRLPQALARRGISTLCVDQPGTGEALRLQGLPATPHSERWASKAVDWLSSSPTSTPRASA